MCFSPGSIPESSVKKIDKVIQRLLKVTTPTEYMVSTKLNKFVNFEFPFMKLSEIDPCGKYM